jgi:TRAP-type transport system small permease protein
MRGRQPSLRREQRMRGRISLVYERLLTGCGFIVGFTIVIIAVLITLDVLLRNLDLYSSGALLELTEYALFVITFVGAPWVLWLGGHVRVDLLFTVVPAPFARAMEIVADAAGLFFSGVMGWHGFSVALVSFERGDLIVKQLVVPEWILMAVIPASCALLSVEFLRRIVATWRAPLRVPADGPHPGGL